jgi:carotenoid cleavage dioxygenase
MTGPFPPPLRLGFDEPCRFEGEILDLEVSEGQIPRDLDGIFTQAVPDYVYAPVSKNLYGMDLGAGGDGMLRALRFKGGRADFVTRYIRTERYLAQREAQRGLFGNYRNPFTDDPAAKGIDRTVANTMINFHAGVLLAGKEDGPSYAIDPITLDTIGPWSAAGAIKSKTTTAHPKFDPATGEMFTFGYFAKGLGSQDIAYYVVDKSGKVKHEAWFEEPVPCMIHDCALTPNYFVLPVMPYSTELARIKAGGPFWVYEPGQETLIGVLPRYGASREIRWFRGPASTLSHTVNAFEENGVIKFDMVLGEGNVFGMIVPDKDGGHAGLLGSVPTYIARWTIDPKSRSDKLPPPEMLATVVGEGPHVDDRWNVKSHRYVWLPEIVRPAGAPVMPMPPEADAPDAMPLGKRLSPVMFNSLSRFDLTTKKKTQWFAGEGASLQDSAFCPRSEHGAEGDGYFVGVRNCIDKQGAEIVILDAHKLEAGPVAVLQVPVPLRMGIHSTFTPGYRIK